ERPACQGEERLSADEAVGAGRHERHDLVAALDEQAHELARLVGGDSTRHPDEHAGHGRHSARFQRVPKSRRAGSAGGPTYRLARLSRWELAPPLPVGRSRSRRSSSSNEGAFTKIVTLSGASRWTASAPSVSRSSSGAFPRPRIRSISDQSVPTRWPHSKSTY